MVLSVPTNAYTLEEWISVPPPPTPNAFTGSSVVEALEARIMEETRREREEMPPLQPHLPLQLPWNTSQAQENPENNGTLVPGSYGNGQGSCTFITTFSSPCSPPHFPQTCEEGMDLESNPDSTIRNSARDNRTRTRYYFWS